MRINGNLVFNSDATGELQNVFIQRLAAAPTFNAIEKGRIYFNTTNSLYYFNDGTAWQPFATGGNATLTQQYLNNLITSVGPAVNSDGTWNGSTAFAGQPVISGATSVTSALILLAQAAAASDTLGELDDVELTALANGQYLRYDSVSSKWVNDTLTVAKITDLTASAAELNILDGATLTTTELNFVDGVTSPIQAQLDAKQEGDATLDGLAALNGTGIVVGTAVDAFTYRSLVAPAAGVTITNADGVAGNPTFALANDLAALEGLATTGYVVRTGDGTATTREITGQAGRIVVTNGTGVASNTDIDLATVTDAGTGTFLKFTTDSYGRVVGTTPVVLADIKTIADGEYVNVTGDTMSGNLTFTSGATVTGLPAPVNGTDAANKNYVDAYISGLTWKNAVHVLADANVDIASAPAAIDGHTLSSGDRVLLTAQTTGSENGIYVFNGAGSAMTRAADADAFAELNGATVFVQQGTVYADTGWTQTATLTSFSGQTWVQFTGAGTYTAGVGLALVGNTFEVNLGAGIFEGPSDAVGIDLYSPAAGALMLTDDGSSRASPLALNSKLHLLLPAGSGLTQDATGLYIPANGITNAMILNDTNGLNADSGSGSLALGQTLLVAGTAAQGIVTSVSGQTFTITASDAAYAQKGVASFDSTDFDVVNGAVSIKTAGVGNAQLENSTLTFAGEAGTPQAVSLGGTLTIGDGGTHTDALHVIKTTAVATNALDIAVRVATDSQLGVASFSNSDFTVTSGAVSIVAKGLDSLTDVAVTGAAAGHTLINDGTNFVNRPIYFLYDGAAATSHQVNHNLGQKYCNVTVVETATDEVVIPQSIVFDSNNQLTVTFTSSIACKVIVMGVNSAASA